jgi:hypothetical protein
MSDWIDGNGNGADKELIEVEIQHCNKELNLPNRFVSGRFGDDGFYFEDGDELSFNWNIIRWRKL